MTGGEARGGAAAVETPGGTAAEPGGLRVRVRRVPGPGLVAVRAWLPGGARVEAAPGEALVAGRSLTEGTRRRDWRRIADDAERLGAAISSSASFEAHGVRVDARATHWSEALEWAAELLAEPVFPEDRCRWVARQVAGELESLADQPEVRTAWRFLEQLYAPHPMSRPLQGDSASLAALTAQDCAEFHLRCRAAGTSVAVAGGVPEDEVADRVRELFREVPRASTRPPEPPPPAGPGERRIVELPPGSQAHLYVGCRTIPRVHPDRFALEMAAVVLGWSSGLSGRMPRRIREQEGLAYTVQVRTMGDAGRDPGRFVVYVGTSPETVERVERAVFDELDRLLQDGVTVQEVDEARAYLLGQDPFRRETAHQWTRLLSDTMLHGQPEDDAGWYRDNLEAVDARAVTEALRRHLSPRAMAVTVGLPESEGGGS